MTILAKLLVMIFSLLVFEVVEGTLAEYVIAFAMIALFGIPHGATDHTLYSLGESQSKSKGLNWKFLGTYLVVMVAYAGLWYLSPFISFIAFLLMSAFHFGEAQLAYTRKLKMINRIAMLSGISFLMILFLPHTDEVSTYIVPYFVSELVYEQFLAVGGYLTVISMLGLVLLLFLTRKELVIKEVIDLILVFVISYNTSLLFAFAIFFVFWHSWDATTIQIFKISLLKKGFNLRSWMKEAAPFSLISWFGIAVLLWLSTYWSTSWPLVTLFFVLVSIITLPHAIVMSRFYSTDYATNSDSLSFTGPVGSETPGGRSKIGSELNMPPS